jgi:hypothetical protein
MWLSFHLAILVIYDFLAYGVKFHAFLDPLAYFYRKIQLQNENKNPIATQKSILVAASDSDPPSD